MNSAELLFIHCSSNYLVALDPLLISLLIGGAGLVVAAFFAKSRTSKSIAPTQEPKKNLEQSPVVPVVSEPVAEKKAVSIQSSPAVSEVTVSEVAAEAVEEPKEHELSAAEVVTAQSAEPVVTPAEVAPISNLSVALKSTREGFVARLFRVLGRKNVVDEELWEELEAALFTADVGVRTSKKLLDTVKARAAKEQLNESSQIKNILIEEIGLLLQKGQGAEENHQDTAAPRVILFVGVNGVGKTTTIGKIAQKFAKQGKSVMLGAGDTFRAAASDQLSVWAKRANAELIQGADGADPASVLFDAVKTGVKHNKDVILCDTAGRLHTKLGLMDQLKKIHKVINNALPGAPHEVYLVLDATTGQNALMQAKQFTEATPLSGIILTKLDGTAKGGVIIGIVDELNIPVKFIGVGESIDDLRPFIADDFVNGLFASVN